MTLLQSRKSLWGLAEIWDTAVKGTPITRLNASHPGRFSNLAAYDSPDYADLCSGTYHFWKRQGWRFYPVNIRYLVPTASVPAKGFPVMVFCLDHPATWNSEWVNFTAQLCLSGLVVIIVELPATGQTLKQQAQTFLEATWLTIATRIGGLADSRRRFHSRRVARCRRCGDTLARR